MRKQQRELRKGWMLFDTESGNAIDITFNFEVAAGWKEIAEDDENLAVIEFEELVEYKKKKHK